MAAPHERTPVRQDEHVLIEVVDSVSFSDSIQLAIREYLSLSHIWSACFLARSADALEQRDDGLPDREARHLALATAAIGAAADFLDATINELIVDAREGHAGGPTQYMTASQRAAIATTTIDLRRPILEKFDAAATAAGASPITRGAGIGQLTVGVLDMKNALTHFVPELVTTYADDPSALTSQEMERRLRPLRLPQNPLASLSQPYFPRRAVGHAPAAWCCTTAMAYVDAYFQLFAVPSPFDHMRGGLSPN